MAVSPYDQEAYEAAESEAALLGALMLDSAKVWPQVRELVNLAHIMRPDHKLLFSAIVGAIEELGSAPPAVVIDRLKAANSLEAAGGLEYILSLYRETTSTVHTVAYARKVREFAGRSKIVDIFARGQARARVTSPEEAAAHTAAELEQARRDYGGPVEALAIDAASAWADEPEPPPREWILADLIPAGRVTSLLGNGGLGKTLLALQIGLHVSTGRNLFGVDVKGGPVLGIFCEDEKDELNRRLRASCGAERITLGDVDRFYALSRDGQDSILCTFDHDHIQLTAFYRQLDATLAALKPVLVILDTAADLFAGDFMSTPHVRQFIKIALGGLCVRHSCAILLLAHPSAAGIASGDGGGFSTAWSNSVRQRMYLSKPKPPEEVEGEEPLDIADKRILAVKKSNYGPDDFGVPLTYVDGYFARDTEPVEAGPGARASRTRIAEEALAYIRSREPLVTPFRTIFDDLQRRGIIPEGDYAIRRKPLFRALKNLLADGVLRESLLPRGYRVTS